MSKLKVWGYKAYVLILKPLHNKISAKTWKYEFVAYTDNGSGYWCVCNL